MNEFDLPPEVIAALDKRAKTQNLDRWDIIRDAIVAYLAPGSSQQRIKELEEKIVQLQSELEEAQSEACTWEGAYHSPPFD